MSHSLCSMPAHSLMLYCSLSFFLSLVLSFSLSPIFPLAALSLVSVSLSLSLSKTQCNQLNASPLHRGNASNKNGPARVKQRMHWEAPSKQLAVDDPLLLLEREVHAEIGINWYLPSFRYFLIYVRILAELLLWKERLGKTRIRTTEGLSTCMEPHKVWTIASSSWNFLRK